jgi:hypothetical protein
MCTKRTYEIEHMHQELILTLSVHVRNVFAEHTRQELMHTLNIRISFLCVCLA